MHYERSHVIDYVIILRLPSTCDGGTRAARVPERDDPRPLHDAVQEAGPPRPFRRPLAPGYSHARAEPHTVSTKKYTSGKQKRGCDFAEPKKKLAIKKSGKEKSGSDSEICFTFY